MSFTRLGVFSMIGSQERRLYVLLLLFHLLAVGINLDEGMSLNETERFVSSGGVSTLKMQSSAIQDLYHIINITYVSARSSFGFFNIPRGAGIKGTFSLFGDSRILLSRSSSVLRCTSYICKLNNTI